MFARNIISATRVGLRSSVSPMLGSRIMTPLACAFSTGRANFQQAPLATEINSPKEIPNLTPLKYEKDIYATVRVHNISYLVTEGDLLTLPFRLIQADVGDILDFNDVTTIGSRNFTYHEDPIPSNAYTIKAVVVEKTKKPMEVKEKTKRRNRHVRHIKSKHPITILRISELKLNV
ncbi:unnamed protein product [Kuraishia capsulata CBS 1993]|uniref:Large ribosomal subunit protein bL21m n=1 Tax=Kuraishia capsulata CBS 1993 TaxID=1382522 RepID=W6MPJ4_9ASCO|nr:uncharacterized protein KUCA_T00003014001 [Kuraishia capsulata CBS 1993]CDK27037.1 unnamed protein product [Kuraishia capsulata CBS 1993]